MKKITSQLFTILFLFFFATGLNAQAVIHTSDFNTSQGEAYTTTGAIGTSPWQISRPGDDWGARIHNNQLELTNTASDAANADGWAFVHLAADALSFPYNTTLASNTEKVYWYFNMRQIRGNPAGFGTNSYGAAFIVAATDAAAAISGSGYAVVLGNTGTPDPIRFVKYTEEGLQALGTAVGGLISATAPLDNPTNNYMSLLLTYNPADHTWELFGRNDGSSAFADPQTGELTLLGTVIDSEYTGIVTPFTGAYWQGSTAGAQTAFFDNITILSDAAAVMPPTISDIIQTPAQDITPATTVSVAATITPGDAAIDFAELQWGTSPESFTNFISMVAGSDNVYTTFANIPAQAHNTTVYYVIQAEDVDGETATSAVQSYQVIDPDADVAIVSVSPIVAVTVELNTPFEELPLPAAVMVTLDNNQQVELDIDWLQGDYNPAQTGTYALSGNLILTGNIVNPSDLQAEIEVIVVEEIIVLDIVSVETFETLVVELGTAFIDLGLPTEAVVTLSDDTTILLAVNWLSEGYNADLAGTYTLSGELVLVDGIENPANIMASIDIEVFEPVLPDLIVGWIFPETSQGADQGIAENIGKLIARESSYEGSYSYTAGATGNAISSNQWADGENVKYWMIELSTLGYGDITLSSKQRSSGTGPRDFKVQYRIGTSGSWADVPNSNVVVGESFAEGVLDHIELPSACNNKPFLFLRWVMHSNTSVGEGIVAPTGTSRIDDIFIHGFFSADFKRIVTGVETLTPIHVEIGTPYNELTLPQTVEVTFDDTGTEMLPVTWLEGDYDGTTLGTYTLMGNIQITEAMENPDNIQAQIDIVVIPEIQYFTVTFNVDMTDANLDPESDEVYITGSMFDNAIPGTLPEQQLMESIGDNIYTKTMTLPEGTYTYKYYINAGIGTPETGPDRILELNQDMTVNDIWLTTRINELSAIQFSVFPNPARDRITIVGNKMIQEIRLIDLKGQTIQTWNASAQELTIVLPALKTGMYILRMQTQGQTVNEKIYIKN